MNRLFLLLGCLLLVGCSDQMIPSYNVHTCYALEDGHAQCKPLNEVIGYLYHEANKPDCNNIARLKEKYRQTFGKDPVWGDDCDENPFAERIDIDGKQVLWKVTDCAPPSVYNGPPQICSTRYCTSLPCKQ